MTGDSVEAAVGRDRSTVIRSVGVVGCGTMGAGIAQVCASAGLDVRSWEVSPRALSDGLTRVADALSKAVAKGKLSADQAKAARERIRGCVEMGELSGVDLVIEAVTEDAAVKREVFGALAGVCPPATLFATNTSSLSVTRLAVATGRPDRFAGLHFFNPVAAMALVEVVPTALTSANTLAALLDLVARLGKSAVRAPDRAGFVVNRLLMPFLLDAVRVLEQGGRVAEIDAAMREGCGHPMGPFALLDLIGLDTAVAIAEALFDEFREPRLAPPPSLRRLVEAGFLGRKSGRGFFDYSFDPPRAADGVERP